MRKYLAIGIGLPLGVLAVMVLSTGADAQEANWQRWLREQRTQEVQLAKIRAQDEKVKACAKAEAALRALCVGWAPEKMGSQELLDLVTTALDACRAAKLAIWRADGYEQSVMNPYAEALSDLESLVLEVSDARMEHIASAMEKSEGDFKRGPDEAKKKNLTTFP